MLERIDPRLKVHGSAAFEWLGYSVIFGIILARLSTGLYLSSRISLVLPVDQEILWLSRIVIGMSVGMGADCIPYHSCSMQPR